MTLSPFEVGGERYYTLILRDVNERNRIEADLQRLRWERSYLTEELRSGYRFEEIVGESPVMKRLLAQVEQVAGADSTVLLLGETGTGKELVAHALHSLSRRREKLLVKLNCAALPGELIESELFGHEKGTFTGATTQRKGRFKLADGGTLFLDEVGELSLPAQAKLLRALQEQEFERVGGTKTLRVDVRVIAATNRDLREDIPLLARHFLRRFAKKLGKPLEDIGGASMERLSRYGWPGNIRELQNVIERAAVLAPGPIIEVELRLGPPGEIEETVPLNGALEEVERAHIQRMLEETGWLIEGKQGAAAHLGLSPSTLRYRMQKLGIKRPPAVY
ncbi:MAG: sigma 54-interacting transcriptional regulator [Beggiatoa sp.]|nr:sigma 54-interacting transcriptional regulator [Beggiatoa sp.]